MSNINLIQATPETESMRDDTYEAPVESRGRRVLRVSGAVLAALVGVGAAAGAVMAKTVAGVIPNGFDDFTIGKLKLIKSGGQVFDFNTGGYPMEVVFGNDLLLATDMTFIGIDPETGQKVLDETIGTSSKLAHDSASGITALGQHGDTDFGWDGALYFRSPDGSIQQLDFPPDFLIFDMKFVNGNLYTLCSDGIRKFSQTSPGQFEQVGFNEFDGQHLECFDYSPAMNALVVGNSISGIHFYDSGTLQEIPDALIYGGLSTLNSNFAINPLNNDQLWGRDNELSVGVLDIPSKQLVKTIPVAGSGVILRVGFSPDGTEFSVAISAQQTKTSRIVIFRIDPQTGQILNENNPEVYFTDKDMHPNSLDVANDEQQPPKDTDNDGVMDADDGCPNDYNPEQTDKDNNGTQDACQETPLDGYTEVFEFDGGSHVHTDGNVLVSVELGQVSMGEDGKANVIHSGNEPIEVTVGAWINFDIEVLEGSVKVPTQDGEQTVSKGDGKVPFGGNPDGVLLALSGTDFVVQTYDFNPPVEPDPETNPEENPEPNLEENPEQAEYVEPMPDVVEQGDFEIIEDAGDDGSDGMYPDETGQDEYAGNDAKTTDSGDSAPDSAEETGSEPGSEVAPETHEGTAGTDTHEPNPDNGGGGKGCSCDVGAHETQQTTWGKIAALLGISFALSAMRRRTRKLVPEAMRDDEER